MDSVHCGKDGHRLQANRSQAYGQDFQQTNGVGTCVPIREAIDWVYASIYTTIKTMKFSHMAPVCGGPVEIAVITTDRLFRWVRHKRFDTAISEGGDSDV